MIPLNAQDVLNALNDRRQPYHDSYLAMYSSWLGGVVTDPVLMLHPIDDHLVHRGDGVFETMKCVAGGIYNLQAHLDRLDHSALAVHLESPMDRDSLVQTIIETVRAGGNPDSAVRLFLSRGPGSFGVNPYESIGAQLVVVATTLGLPFMQKHPEGAHVKSSSIPAKPARYAGIKNCNYHPNVLMSREAVDLGTDFVASYDESGFLAEGATENIGIVDSAGSLTFPDLEGILSGTTMMRVCELAQTLVACGDLSGVVFRHISRDEIFAAREVLIVGTTRNVTAVRKYDDTVIGDGTPGPVWKALSERLEEDIRHNVELRTEVFAS
jgi:branched-subunit amino acid aminotransferase/4-amino-4-deoxychorismate lyase